MFHSRLRLIIRSLLIWLNAWVTSRKSLVVEFRATFQAQTFAYEALKLNVARNPQRQIARDFPLKWN